MVRTCGEHGAPALSDDHLAVEGRLVELTTSFPMRGFDQDAVGDHRVAFRSQEKGWQVSAEAAMTGSSGRKKIRPRGGPRAEEQRDSALTA
jgi:hypothetical protein